MHGVVVSQRVLFTIHTVVQRYFFLFLSIVYNPKQDVNDIAIELIMSITNCLLGIFLKEPLKNAKKYTNGIHNIKNIINFLLIIFFVLNNT